MTTSVSSLGRTLQSTTSLQAEQATLATLTQQLASQQKYSSLTGYDPVAAKQLLDFQNGVTQRQGNISAMQTVSTQLSSYDLTMTNMESIASQASSLASQNTNYDPTKLANLQSQAQSYLSSITNDLNQQMGGQYIYAGSRYNTPPVVDLNGMTAAPVAGTVTSPTLPTYDTSYVSGANPASSDANAYTQNAAMIDTGYQVSYGVTSTNPAFQNLISGMQFLKAATTPGVTAANYQTDITQASTLLNSALSGIQTLHAGVAQNINLMTTQTATQTTDISNLQSQVSNIQQVDMTQIGAEIQAMQTQMQASYSATASLATLSLVKYL